MSVRGVPPVVAYRPLFGAGALHAIAIVALWFLLQEARRTGAPFAPAATVPPGWVHAHALVFGTFACFVFGFLGTAFPRWIDAPPPGTRRILAWLAALIAAQVALVAGYVFSPTLLGVAFALELGAYAALLAFLGTALARSRTPRRLQPGLVLGALALAPIAIALDAIAMLRLSPPLHAAAVEIALRGHLLFLVAGVAQRIVPFFTANVLGRAYAPRPPAALATWVGLGLARIALAIAGGPHVALAVLDGAMALLLARELVAWRPGRALRSPMIAILFLGLAWVALGLAGSALANARPALGPWLDLPVRHALGIGGFATLVIGMSSRVALGHRGRPIVAGPWILAAFASIQLAALLRVSLALLGGVIPAAPTLSHLAAIPWVLAFALWLIRLGPLLRQEPTAAPRG